MTDKLLELEYEQARELEAAGWRRAFQPPSAFPAARIWRSPKGKLYGGLKTAWRKMRAEAADGEAR